MSIEYEAVQLHRTGEHRGPYYYAVDLHYGDQIQVLTWEECSGLEELRNFMDWLEKQVILHDLQHWTPDTFRKQFIEWKESA